MIDEFGQERLQRRQKFLGLRAKAHLAEETNRSWHQAAAATLLRDAAAIAFMRDEIEQGRDLLQRSGTLFFDLGFPAGLQLIYIAGRLETQDEGADSRINRFREGFSYRRSDEARSASPDISDSFNEQAFQPPQLLRAYQALAGRITADEEWSGFRGQIHERLSINAAMPVGSTRTAMATYLDIYDQFTGRTGQPEATRLGRVLNSLAERREEFLNAARRDHFHWKTLLRPAELIDFDLLALLLAGVRRGQRSALISQAFVDRDALTVLPQTLAKALSH